MAETALPPSLPEPGNGARLAWLRRHTHVLLWAGLAAVFAINALANTAVLQLEHARLGRDTAPWQIAAWEWSSAVMFMLLVPAVVAMERRFPLAWTGLGRGLAAHAAGSVLFSLAHVVGMVLLREAVYALNGSDYSFGDWPRELVYEYLKDGRVYLVLLLAAHLVGLWVRRSQGEAHWLAPREDVPAAEAAAPAPTSFLVRKLGREFLVPAAEIEHAVAAGNYANLHVRGKDYPLRVTIAALEEQLDPALFMRVHRGVIVNLGQVVRVEPLDSGEARVHVRNGAVLPCSRRYRKELRERFREPSPP
jgi:hypothetical protein